MLTLKKLMKKLRSKGLTKIVLKQTLIFDLNLFAINFTTSGKILSPLKTIFSKSTSFKCVSACISLQFSSRNVFLRFLEIEKPRNKVANTRILSILNFMYLQIYGDSLNNVR